MANRGVVIFLLSVAMLIATFIVGRVFIPSLVNMQNDGALILAVVLAVASFVGWIYFLSFFIKFVSGEYR